jgi:hypothetical protein
VSNQRPKRQAIGQQSRKVSIIGHQQRLKCYGCPIDAIDSKEIVELTRYYIMGLYTTSMYRRMGSSAEWFRRPSLFHSPGPSATLLRCLLGRVGGPIEDRRAIFVKGAWHPSLLEVSLHLRTDFVWSTNFKEISISSLEITDSAELPTEMEARAVNMEDAGVFSSSQRNEDLFFMQQSSVVEEKIASVDHRLMGWT